MKFHFTKPLIFGMGCFITSLVITFVSLLNPEPNVVVLTIDGIINGMGWGAIIAECLRPSSTTCGQTGENKEKL